MRSKLRSPLRQVIVAIAVLAFAALAWRGWATRAPAEAAIRSELVLRDGLLYRPSASRPFSGVLVENWRPAQRRVEVTIAAGRAPGRSRGWYENGQVEVEENFVRGVSDGRRTRWYDTGVKKSSGEIRAGELVGTFREWHPNGTLARETPLEKGVAHGEVKAWDAGGKSLASAQVEHGRKIGGNP